MKKTITALLVLASFTAHAEDQAKAVNLKDVQCLKMLSSVNCKGGSQGAPVDGITAHGTCRISIAYQLRNGETQMQNISKTSTNEDNYAAKIIGFIPGVLTLGLTGSAQGAIQQDHAISEAKEALAVALSTLVEETLPLNGINKCSDFQDRSGKVFTETTARVSTN